MALSRALRLCFAGCVWLALLAAGVSAAYAQGTGLVSTSYITPFPQTDRYQVRVIGDWLGQGLTAALQEAFKQEGSVEITGASRPAYGLARADQTGLYNDIDRMIAGQPAVNIAFIMLGANDRASLRGGGGRPVQPGSAEWKEAYSKEAEKLIKKLKSANIAVYWVGLPVMSNPAFSEAVAAMNDAARQAAYVNGAKFIETWAGFTDQLGAFAAYGPDLAGQTRRLREPDGVGLTAAGNRKLANYVEIVLRRDLAYAKSQRNIPLAGDEEEQSRVVPGGVHGAFPAKAVLGPASPQDNAAAASPARTDQANPAAANQASAGDDAIPAAQDLQRRDQAAFGSSGYQGGEFILGDLGDGLTAIAVITPGDLSTRELQRQTPLADRAYFKVLSKGETLPAKEGRADDFRWAGNGAAAQPQ